MANRDIIVLNTTQSRAETQQSSDTVRIKGGGEILSIENSSASPILTVQSSGSQTTLTGKITSTGNITGSSISASFGRVEGTTLIGSAFELSNSHKVGTVSASSQIASYITGSFRDGFEFTGTISGSGGSTGSFDRIVATTFVGDANNLGKSSELPNTVSASSVIADDISGSFNKGFEFSSGNISGSATTTGSFGTLIATTLVGSAANLTNTDKTNTISSSAQLASRISGSFNKGFEFDGEISASISGSATFTTLTAKILTGDGSALTNTIPTGTVTGSAQVATRISGSFNKGFEYSGTIKKSPAAWSATNAINTARTVTTAFGSQNATVLAGGNTAPHAHSETWNGTNWSEGNDLNTGRQSAASAGTATAGLVFGGATPGSNNRDETEEYDGTSYSEVNDLTTGRYTLGGFGTQNSAIAAGGAVPGYNNICKLTEEWNGTNWSEVNDLNNPRWYFGSAGDSSESGIIFGGSYASPAFSTGIATTEQWNGSSWSEVNDLNVNLLYTRGQGSTNNAIVAGGLINSPTNTFSKCTETWDGTSWSIEGSLNVATRYLGIGGNGGGAIAAGFSIDPSPYKATNSELFEVSFTTASFERVIASKFVGSGTNITNIPFPTGVVSGSAQLASNISASFQGGFEFSSGNISGSVTSTGSFGRIVATKFTGDGSNLTNTVIPGTISSSAQISASISGSWNMGFQYKQLLHSQLGSWSAGGNLNTSRNRVAGFGTQGGLIVAGGTSPAAPSTNAPVYGRVSCVEAYDGSSWSECNNINTTRDSMMAAGTPSAGIVYGGGTAPPTAVSCVEEWNGTNWSEVTNMNENRKHSGDAGDTSEAVLQFGGEFASPAHYTETAEEYNGSNWSEIGDMVKGKTNVAGLGNTEAALAVGGNPNPGGHAPGNDIDVEEWNGSNWSLITPTLDQNSETYYNRNGSGAGTVNDAHVFGGFYQYYRNPTVPSYIYCYDARSQHYDGTSWSYGGRLITGRYDGGGDGTSGANGIYAGGYNPSSPTTANTEEYISFYATASFGSVIANCLFGDACTLDNISFPVGTITSSAQVASDISGSFNKGFEYTGDIRTAKGVWSVGGSLNTGRTTTYSAGTANAALAGGGQTHPTTTANSEEYNGTAWTEGNNMITSRFGGDAGGTQNAAVMFGGSADCSCTEEYNGTSYASAGAMNLGRNALAGAGTQNSALAISGYTPSYDVGKSETELYDGAAWSEVADVNNQKGNSTAAGSSNATITWDGYGSETAGLRRITEIWDGTSWSSGALTVGTLVNNHAGSGTVNAAFHAGGSAPALALASQHYDGNAWSIDGDINVGRQRVRSGNSTQANGLIYGGGNPGGSLTCTEEYNTYYTTGSFGRVETPDVQIAQDSQLVVSSSLQLPVFSDTEGIVSSSAGQMWFNSTTRKLNFTMDVNSWSAGGNMNLARAYVGGTGIQNAALAVGGTAPADTPETELYDGSAWSVAGSEAHDLDVSRWGLTATGTQNSALAFGGYDSPATTYAKTEAFPGTAWAECADMNQARMLHAGIGTQNAALASAGYTNVSEAELDNTEEWDGTAWYAAADNNTARRKLTGGGTQNAGIIFGGSVHPAMSKLTETYDGTTWTERNDMVVARGVLAGGGTQNAAVAFGGAEPAISTKTEEWNGTSWSVGNVMGTARSNLGGAGSQSSGLAFSGNAPGLSAATEEYSVTSLKTVEIDGV